MIRKLMLIGVFTGVITKEIYCITGELNIMYQICIIELHMF